MKLFSKHFSTSTRRTQMRRPIFAAAVIVTASALLTGCGKDGGFDMAGLSGSGAMQIDVEVYKGPLSKEYEIQKAELKGVLLDGQKTFHVLKGNIEISLRRLGCFVYDETVPDKFLLWDGTREAELPLPPDFEKFFWFEPRFPSEIDGRPATTEKNDILNSKRTELGRAVSKDIGLKSKLARAEKILEEAIRAYEVEDFGQAWQSSDSTRNLEILLARWHDAYRKFVNAAEADKLAAFRELPSIANNIVSEFNENKWAETISEQKLASLNRLVTAARKLAELASQSLTLAETAVQRADEIFKLAQIDQEKDYKKTSTRKTVPHPFIIARDLDGDGKYKICPILQNLWAETVYIGKVISQLTPAIIDDYNRTLTSDGGYGADPANFRMKVARLAETMRGRARFWATEHAAISPNEGRVRVEMADVTNFLADYGNPLGARADALEKQNNGSATKLAKLLSTTSFLRDSSTTDYLNLYDWNKASVEREGVTATDRVRLVEQLVADTYWTNINRVFASGQGTVRMAFIKDDIGNWNLKRFENDPTKLVEAYRNAGLAVVEEVANLATNPGGAGDRLLGFANRITGGSTPPADVGAVVTGLHGQAVEQIQAIGDSQQQRASVLGANIQALRREMNDNNLETAASSAAATTKAENDKLDTANGQLLTKQGELDALPAIAIPPDVAVEARRETLTGEKKTRQLEVDIAALKVEFATIDQANREKVLADAKAEIVALERDKERIGPETVRLIRQVLTMHAGTLDQVQQTATASGNIGITDAPKKVVQ